MPVKVRCPGCERVLNAPDRARGKAIKCPECGTKVRVPAAQAPKKAVARPPSTSVAIANLDLDRLDDAANRICPKCGAEVSEEDVECPECHVNLESGMLSAKKKAELSRKGPDPRHFYKEFFRDGFEFWKKHKYLALRLTLISGTLMAVFAGCVFLSLWSVKPLVRYFWVFCAGIAVLVPPGLAFNLHTTIIDLTLRKKKKVGKYHFDKFLGAALGLKLLAWFLVIAAPLHLLALAFLILWIRGIAPPGLAVAGALELVAVVFASYLFPIMMAHMAMPVTWPGWLVHKMSKPFFRTFPALSYWCFFLFLTMLGPLLCVGAAGYLSGGSIVKLVADANENTRVFLVKRSIEDLPKDRSLSPEQQATQSKEVVGLDFMPMIVPSILLVVAGSLFGLTAVFLMRANGLYAYYFLDRLDLVTMAEEIKYVPKATTLDEIESRKGVTWNTVLAGLGVGFVAAFAFGGASATLSGKPFLAGAGWGLLTGGILIAIGGYFWLLVEAFIDSMAWFGALILSWSIGFTASLWLGPVSNSLSLLLPIVYGILNWSNTKFPLIVMVSGTVYFFIGLTLTIVGAVSEAL
jgi:hypothetical protein